MKTKSPRSNKFHHRWVISVLFPDGTVKYLAGHAGLSTHAVCLFDSDPETAVWSMQRDTMTFGWPYLIGSHARATNQSLKAVVHKVSDAPQFTQ
jgi:hypothetical protein